MPKLGQALAYNRLQSAMEDLTLRLSLSLAALRRDPDLLIESLRAIALYLTDSDAKKLLRITQTDLPKRDRTWLDSTLQTLYKCPEKLHQKRSAYWLTSFQIKRTEKDSPLIRVGTKISVVERQKLEMEADRQGLTLSQFVRKALKDATTNGVYLSAYLHSNLTSTTGEYLHDGNNDTDAVEPAKYWLTSFQFKRTEKDLLDTGVFARISDQEHQQLELEAEKNGLKISQFVRSVLREIISDSVYAIESTANERHPLLLPTDGVNSRDC